MLNVLKLLAWCVSGVLVMAQASAAQAQQSAMHCNSNMATLPELEPIAKRVVLTSDGRPTLEMQGDEGKPNAEERKALSIWMARRDECFKYISESMAALEAPAWLTSATRQFRDNSDGLIASLYRGELTYGDYNFKVAALQAELRRRLDDGAAQATRRTAESSVNADGMAQAEPKRDQGSDLHSCKTEAARTYPVLIVQRMVDPGFQAPQTNQGTTTRCNSVGGQVICDSTPRAGLGASIYNRPPRYVDEDANAGRRMAAFESCMSAKGYKRR